MLECSARFSNKSFPECSQSNDLNVECAWRNGAFAHEGEWSKASVVAETASALLSLHQMHIWSNCYQGTASLELIIVFFFFLANVWLLASKRISLTHKNIQSFISRFCVHVSIYFPLILSPLLYLSINQNEHCHWYEYAHRWVCVFVCVGCRSPTLLLHAWIYGSSWLCLSPIIEYPCWIKSYDASTNVRVNVNVTYETMWSSASLPNWRTLQNLTKCKQTHSLVYVCVRIHNIAL